MLITYFDLQVESTDKQTYSTLVCLLYVLSLSLSYYPLLSPLTQPELGPTGKPQWATDMVIAHQHSKIIIATGYVTCRTHMYGTDLTSCIAPTPFILPFYPFLPPLLLSALTSIFYPPSKISLHFPLLPSTPFAFLCLLSQSSSCNAL